MQLQLLLILLVLHVPYQLLILLMKLVVLELVRVEVLLHLMQILIQTTCLGELTQTFLLQVWLMVKKLCLQPHCEVLMLLKSGLRVVQYFSAIGIGNVWL